MSAAEIKSVLFFVLFYLALLASARSLRFVTLDTAVFDPLFREKYSAHLPIILIHGFSAIAALVIGPFEFIAAIRRKFTVMHRVLGRVYFTAILFGGLSGFFMGSMAYGGIVSQTAFCVMAALWLVTGWKGYRAIRARRIAEHRDWMIRNYALTFGAVTLRVYLGLLQPMGYEFEAIYAATVLFAWLPNLAVAEFLIRSPSLRALRVSA